MSVPQDTREQKRRTYYIETYGCQMNEYDSQIAATLLDREQVQRVNSPDEADLVLLNTCAVRENAHTKIYHRLQHLKKVRQRGGKVAILGCMAQNLREELFEKELPVDVIMGPDALRNLPRLLNQSEVAAEKSFLKLSRQETYDDIFPAPRAQGNPISAFVTIQRGCDNFCSFCVVPYTRGRERSRPLKSVVSEIQQLTQRGIRTVTLLGQNVNSYRFEKYDFADLIRAILDETTLERLYFTSPHPKDYPEKLLHLMAENPRFCNYVHMPLQAGSNSVLRNMKRNYTRESFVALVRRFREAVPDLAISTDVIVGFPGESEADFQETLEVMDQADFDSAFMFAYSQRKGTIAARLYEDNIPQPEKMRRLEEVIRQQNERSLRKNQAYIGRVVSVMVEGMAPRNHQEFLGRMTNYRKVIFPVGVKVPALGDVLEVKITSATSASLRGELV